MESDGDRDMKCGLCSLSNAMRSLLIKSNCHSIIHFYKNFRATCKHTQAYTYSLAILNLSIHLIYSPLDSVRQQYVLSTFFFFFWLNVALFSLLHFPSPFQEVQVLCSVNFVSVCHAVDRPGL